MIKQKGFTLIELVLVIVLVAILAATALPRFSDISREARIAAIEGLGGGMRGAAAIAHSTQLAQNLASNTSITMEGQTVTMLNGYPTADTAGITQALSDVTGFADQTNGVFQKTGAANPATCTVTYNAATPTVAATVDVDPAGC